MNVDARRLKILSAVIQAGGVGEAGRVLAMTPQAISQQIATLEREVGTELFDRSRRRLEPTLLAQELARHGDRIETELLAARRCVATSTGLVSGPVRIATFQSAIRWLVASALPQIRLSAPGIEPEIVEMTGLELQRALRSGIVDLVIDEIDKPERGDPAVDSVVGIVSTVIRPDPYRVVAAKGRGKAIRTPSEALKQPWIVAPIGAACRSAFDRLVTSRNTQPRIVHTCLEFPAVLALVEAAEGIALIPALGLLEPATVEVCPVRGLGRRDLIALQRKSRSGTEPAVDAVIKVLMRAHTH